MSCCFPSSPRNMTCHGAINVLYHNSYHVKMFHNIRHIGISTVGIMNTYSRDELLPPLMLWKHTWNLLFLLLTRNLWGSLRRAWILWRQGCMGWRWLWMRSLVIWPSLQAGCQTGSLMWRRVAFWAQNSGEGMVVVGLPPGFLPLTQQTAQRGAELLTNGRGRSSGFRVDLSPTH